VFPDADGGMTIAGTGTASSTSTPQLLRLLPSGQADDSFGSGGVSPSPEPGNAAFGLAAVRGSDGRAILVGTTDFSGHRGALAVRYTPAGQIDGSFGSGGRFRSQLASGSYGDSGLSGVALQSDGKLLVAGFRTDSSTGSDAARYVVAGRLNANGTPDAGFGEGGFTKAPLSTWGYYGDQHIVALPDGGALLTVGDRTDSGGSRLLVVRLGPDGKVAASRTISAGVEPYPWAIAPAPGGEAVVVGHTRPEGDNNPLPFAIRLTPTGEPDSGWATGGVWIGTARGRADGVAVGGDGSTFLAGATADDKLAVTKLQGDGGGAGGGPGGGGAGGGTGGAGTGAFVVGRAVMRRGMLMVRVRCTATTACRGRASLLPRRGKGRALAAKDFRAAAGKTVRLKLRPKRRPRTARLRVALSAPVNSSRTLAVRLR
jgi:uncharacterized delta-60 repeat protein